MSHTGPWRPRRLPDIGPHEVDPVAHALVVSNLYILRFDITELEEVGVPNTLRQGLWAVAVVLWAIVCAWYAGVIGRRFKEWARSINNEYRPEVRSLEWDTLLFRTGYIEAAFPEIEGCASNIVGMSELVVDSWADWFLSHFGTPSDTIKNHLTPRGTVPLQGSPELQQTTARWRRDLRRTPARWRRILARVHCATVVASLCFAPASFWFVLILVLLRFCASVFPFTCPINQNPCHYHPPELVMGDAIVVGGLGMQLMPIPLAWKSNVLFGTFYFLMQTMAAWRGGVVHHSGLPEMNWFPQWRPVPFTRMALLSLFCTALVGRAVAMMAQHSHCSFATVCRREVFPAAPADTCVIGADETDEHEVVLGMRMEICAKANMVGLKAAIALSALWLWIELALPYLLRRAIYRNDMTTLASLVKLLGPDIRTVDGPTALQTAAACGRLDAVVLLVEAGADLEAFGPSSCPVPTPLSLAAVELHTPVVEYLLGKGARLPLTPSQNTILGERHTSDPRDPELFRMMVTLNAGIASQDEPLVLAGLRSFQALAFRHGAAPTSHVFEQFGSVPPGWSIRIHRLLPRFCKRWVLTLVLCTRRIGMLCGQQQARSSSFPNLPIEMVLAVLSSLRPGDMRSAPPRVTPEKYLRLIGNE